jgi:GT2 family glycosyltransferase
MGLKMEKKELSIILPVLNCLNYTKGFLRTIKTGRRYGLILINNGSTDGTADYFSHLGSRPDVFVKNFDKNIGVAAAWNYGIKAAYRIFNSDYFFIANNDILLSPVAIDNLIAVFSNPSIVLSSGDDVSGRVVAPDDVLAVLGPSREKLKPHPDFSCFMLGKKAIARIGFFDENFYPAYFEDNDYHYRIRLAGLRAVKTNRAPYFHFGSRTIRENAGIRELSNAGYLANRDYYVKKWGGLPGKEKYKTPFGK